MEKKEQVITTGGAKKSLLVNLTRQRGSCVHACSVVRKSLTTDNRGLIIRTTGDNVIQSRKILEEKDIANSNHTKTVPSGIY